MPLRDLMADSTTTTHVPMKLLQHTYLPRRAHDGLLELRSAPDGASVLNSGDTFVVLYFIEV